MTRTLSTAMIVALVGGLASSASAVTSIYTDRATFLTALGGAATVDDPFDNDIARAQSITFDSGVVSTNSDVPEFDDNSVVFGVYNNAVDGNGSSASQTVEWVFPQQIFAFGFDVSDANFNDLSIRGDFSGTGVEQIDVNETIGGSNGFLGVIGMSSFDSVEFFSRTTDLDIYDVDNLVFAPADDNGAVVPEPVTGLLGLIAMGTLGLAASRRRRVA